MKGAWIETFSGKAFHLLDPRPEDICIEDIAHALSNQCRWTGHTSRFYSTAEHSVFVARLCTLPARLAGLLHDASEAYLSDLSRPVKHCTPVGEIYRELEAKIQSAINLRFGITEVPPEVKMADDTMLITEKVQLMTNLPWDSEEEWQVTAKRAADVVLPCWSPKEAEKEFLDEFERVAR